MTTSSIPVASGSGGATSADVNGFRVSDVRFPPRVRLGDHSHERACLAVVVEGDVDKRFRALAIPSPTATVLTMPPREPHVDEFGRDGARIVVVEPDETTVERLRPFVTALDGVAAFRDLGSVGVATRLAHELHAVDGAARLALEGLVLELLARVARAPERSARRPPPWLADATDYVHARFREAFRVGDVAAAVGVHPVHLARVFRVQHGVPIGDYVPAADRLGGARARLVGPAARRGRLRGRLRRPEPLHARVQVPHRRDARPLPRHRPALTSARDVSGRTRS